MVATAGGGLAVAEPEAGDGFTDGSVVSGADSFGTEPIGVAEDSAARIRRKVATAGEGKVQATVGTVASVDGSVAGEIVEIEDSAVEEVQDSLGMLPGGGFLDALAKSVVCVDGGGASVNLSDAIFGVEDNKGNSRPRKAEGAGCLFSGLPVLMFRVVLLHWVIGFGVVLVVVDLLAGVVLLVVHLCAFLRRELAAVGRAVVAHFAIDVRFAIFQVTGFARSQLPRLHAIGNASLLIGFASVGAAHGCSCGPAMIFGRKIGAIRSSEMLVRSLHGSCANMGFMVG